MSFGESVFSAGFNQKIDKGDLNVKEKNQNFTVKPTLEGSRGF